MFNRTLSVTKLTGKGTINVFTAVNFSKTYDQLKVHNVYT